MNFVELLNIIVDHGWDINQRGPYNRTMLITLSQENNVSGVKKLLELEASVNVQDTHGSSALSIASEYDNKEIVQMLLDNNADQNLIDNDKDTALICSSWKNNIEIIKKLVQYNPDIRRVNKLNKNAIHYSIENGLTKKEIDELYNIDLEIEYIDLDPGTNCLICYQEIEKNMEINKCNDCKNVFCRKCLVDWFTIDNLYTKKCAYCKNNWVQEDKLFCKL